MGIDPQSIVVALVLLHSASGEVVDGSTAITADTIERYRPLEENASQAREAFIQNGFEAGPLAGIGFSITASVDTFNQFFNISIKHATDAGYQICRQGTKLDTFPLDQLPKELAQKIATISFDQPVESFY